MAAPPEKTMDNLSGKWMLERKLSTGMDEVMALQGLSWIKIKALSMISVTELCKQCVDENNVTHIDISPTVTGGFKGQPSSHIADGVERETVVQELGAVLETCRWTDLFNIKDSFLRDGWVCAKEHGAGPRALELNATMQNGACVLKCVWGFVNIDGKRYHARKTTCTKGEKVARCCAVYSWREDA